MEAPKPPAAAGAVEVVVSFSATEVAGVVPLVAWVVFGPNKFGAGADVVVAGAEVVADVVALLAFPRLGNRDDVCVGAEPSDVVGVALPNRLVVCAGAVVAGVDDLELATPNGLGACVTANGEDVVAVDVKLNVGLGTAAEEEVPLLSVVDGFVAFSPLKRPAPLAGVAVLGANKLPDDPLVVVAPPNKPLDCVVAGFGAESEGF